MERNKNLTLTNNSALPAIPDAQALAKIRLDKNIPRYKDIARDMRIPWLIQQIFTLYMIKHLTPDDEQIAFDASALDEFIMDDYFASDYTLPEIKDSFKRGMMGDYGEYFGITSESLYAFIRGYFMSEKKREATKIVRQHLSSTKEQPKGEFYLEKVRVHAEQMAKEKTEWKKK